MNLDDHYRLADGVAIRPERFGSLVYNYSTRQLYFIHSHDVAALIDDLADGETLGTTLDTFCRRRGLPPADVERLRGSISSLHALGVVVSATGSAA